MSRDEPRMGLTSEGKVSRSGDLTKGALVEGAVLLKVARGSTLKALMVVESSRVACSSVGGTRPS